MERNPFKFGSIVEGQQFTNRIKEIDQVNSILNSKNHLILISPRRYGKSSLIHKVMTNTDRPVISLDLQLITGVDDFAAQLLKRIYRIYPTERITQYIRNFRIIPSIIINPVTNAVDVSFQPTEKAFPKLEDVFNLIEKLSSEKKRCIVILDEFQEIERFDRNLTRQLRSILQYHQKVNYIFMGSQESMIRDIFEIKKSPFYHFGLLMNLSKISRQDFFTFIEEKFMKVVTHPKEITNQILDFTNCHPYFTQQLAFQTWELLSTDSGMINPVDLAVKGIINVHDMNFEKLWNTFNNTDKKLLIGLTESEISPLSENFYRKYNIGTPSTVFSSIKRIAVQGHIIKSNNKYEIDDPFFARWIRDRRNQ